MALAGGATANAFAIEPRRVALSRHSLGAAGGPTIRIVQLSDLHLRTVSRHEAHVAEVTIAARPDLVLFTGDAIDRADSLPLIERFLTLLPRDTPKLAILGNWEYWGQVDIPRLAKIYDARNCRLLRNESVTLSIDGVRCSYHTHGGQIAPFGWAPLRPPGSGRYVRGWYRDAGIPMYVSRGIGTSIIPARLGNVPEVASFDWTLSR